MGAELTPATSRGALDDHQLRVVVTSLCLGQITSWGVLYYALPVLTTAIALDTGWSASAVVAAFSCGLVVNALAGIAVGRAIDRQGPRSVMVSGSVLAVPAVGVVALAPTYPAFLSGWVLTGLAMSAVLYAPSFAAVTGWAGSEPQRRLRALTVITLLGGLASTVFAPLTASLLSELGWRSTYLVLAVVLGVITIPAHVMGLRYPWQAADQAPAQLTDTGRLETPAAASRQPAFWILAAAFTLIAFAVYASVINLVPLLHENGTTITTASLVLGLGGIGQVAGRLLWAPIVTRTALPSRTGVVFAVVGLTTAAFAVVSGPVAALVVLAIVAGMARGVVTLLQATAVSDRWGTRAFGRHNGLLTAPIMTASAVAPFAGAFLASQLGSYALSFAVMAAAALLAAVLVPLSRPAASLPQSGARREK